MSSRTGPTSPRVDDKARRRGPVIEQAGEWLLDMEDAELSRQQRERLVDSLRESPALVAELLRAEQVNKLLRDFDQWHRIEPLDIDANDASVIVPLRSRDEKTVASAPRRWAATLIRLALGSVAATLLIVLGLTVWNTSLGWRTIQTDAGERRELMLADGSIVQVGPTTRLRVRMKSAHRRIVLEYGDALFRVAKDKTRPFTVEAATTVVRAVGTAFAVEHQADEVVVTVAEGRVAVTRPAAKTMTFAAVPPPEEVALSAGQQVSVAPSGLGTVRAVDSQRELAWAEGWLVFEREPVVNVIEQFNRRNHVQLRLRDASLEQRPVSGVFDAFDPASFAAFLSLHAPVTITRMADKIVIEPAGDQARRE
jgi:transmembrane sensor